jgi:hypothetical protein
MVCHLLRVERDFVHVPHIHKTTGYPLRATASRASFSGDRGFFPDLNRDSIASSMPVARARSAPVRFDASHLRSTAAGVASLGAAGAAGVGTVAGGGAAGVAAGVGAGALVLSFVCSKSSARRMTSGFSWCPKSEAN